MAYGARGQGRMDNRFQNSKEQFAIAQRYIATGVNSPVRSYVSVGGTPRFIRSGSGARVTDVDGSTYLDYVGSYGALILGHAHPDIVACVQKTAETGLSFGAPTEFETALAQRICKALPSVERLRLVSSGTEACMSALRLARGVTGRAKIVKFSGCYHGHADMLLAKAGSGAATQGIASSAGVPAALVQDTLTVPYNSITALQQVFSQHDIAAVIVEPIIGNCSLILPLPDYLFELRKMCTQHGALLIFDEVMTGFRGGWGGVQTLEQISPDLTTLGKVIGGGLPLAAFGGKKKIMDLLAPTGEVYQAGTMSGNPIAAACGAKTLDILADSSVYQHLDDLTTMLVAGIRALAHDHSIPLQAQAKGGMFGIFFADEPLQSYEQAMQCDTSIFKRFFWEMLQRGVYLAPSPFEAGFVSVTHTKVDIEMTLAAVDASLATLRI